MSLLSSRRELLTQAGLAAGTVAAGLATTVNMLHAAPAESPAVPTFRHSLNTSTLRGQKLPITELVEIAAKAGYDALEPWINELETFVKEGGQLSDLRKRIADHGLAVVSAIGFAPWMVDDDAARAKGLEQAKHDMDLVRQIGGTRIAAPPAGAYDVEQVDLFAVAQRYRALLELGEKMEVTPQIEFWGGAKSLYRMAQVAFVVAECGHPNACLLPDVYHIFRGGSPFEGIQLFAGRAIHVFHVNDYPGNIPREKQTDADRVYPGDGVAPLGELFRNLQGNGFQGYLSLELFNRDYWQQDPLTVARTGLEKTKAAVAKSVG